MCDMVQKQLDHSHWVNQTMNKPLAASHLSHLEKFPPIPPTHPQHPMRLVPNLLLAEGTVTSHTSLGLQGWASSIARQLL